MMTDKNLRWLFFGGPALLMAVYVAALVVGTDPFPGQFPPLTYEERAAAFDKIHAGQSDTLTPAELADARVQILRSGFDKLKRGVAIDKLSKDERELLGRTRPPTEAETQESIRILLGARDGERIQTTLLPEVGDTWDEALPRLQAIGERESLRRLDADTYVDHRGGYRFTFQRPALPDLGPYRLVHIEP